ncbi:anthranilate synthase component I family protein [Lysinibacter sp. HNR]|uniref:anthranilate synthase component I family protein n=1 Tax=Lysinibacter sp. HNR TaxID=3031408 RepID=UPI002434B0AC|nr:anthranilate synthase component I family protein [Lysinibacter sp. HNR]WGD37487.1 anthranilate synthase component I family protein [Lysinibacter sp. HNR]
MTTIQNEEAEAWGAQASTRDPEVVIESIKISSSRTLNYRELDQEISTPELFRALVNDNRDAVWLDSARRAYQMGNYSIIAPRDPRVDPLVTYNADLQRVGVEHDGKISYFNNTIEDYLDTALPQPDDTATNLPFPFVGGYVGYLGYGCKGVGDTTRTDPTGKDAQLVFVSRFAIVDHAAGGRVYLAALSGDDHASQATAHRWIREAAHRVETLAEKGGTQHPGSATNNSNTHNPADNTSFSPGSTKTPLVAHSSVSQEEYLAAVEEVQSWLRRGESYEACYTYQLSFPHSTEDSWHTYQRLRNTNPAPYGAFLRFGERSVLSCSPERFVSITPTGVIESKPIKGTAARSEVDDDAVSERLRTDPKNRAENLMIVDLLRNDLGRICEVGSIEVTTLMGVETYETVHQLVSTIRGQLAPQPPSTILTTLFPGGSMTGAPKIRTVQLLDQLEKEPRGVYSGAIGYFSLSGQVDLSIVIRTATIDGGRVTVGTGGAITVLSEAADELSETILKTAPLLEAFDVSHPFAAR